MYIGSQELMSEYDEYLLNRGYRIEELVDKASDCLLKHIVGNTIGLFCGPGNNGADGLSLAIKLKNLGKKVYVFAFDSVKSSQANQYYMNQCFDQDLFIMIITEENVQEVMNYARTCDELVDAIFGNGLNSSPKGIYQIVIEEINQLMHQDILSIDIPTGLDCNTGIPYQSVVCASRTISLSALKNGFLNLDSQMFTGEVIVEYLEGIDVSEEVGLYQLVDVSYIASLLKERQFNGHKGIYGKAGLITGCSEYKGAALLSAKSCVYSGAGITSVITTNEVIDSLTYYVPEATAMERMNVLSEDVLSPYTALLVGCGLGLSIESYRYVLDVLTLSKQNLVIDADALTILSKNINLLQKQDREIILTPHLGEFKRLVTINKNDDILKVAKKFALQHHVVLVLKGPFTIVTNGINSYRVAAGDKAMASGGMGDVLSGIIVSLLAQGYNALQAALLGVFIHGKAGEEVAKNQYTVIASQLIEQIPIIMNTIIKRKSE